VTDGIEAMNDIKKLGLSDRQLKKYNRVSRLYMSTKAERKEHSYDEKSGASLTLFSRLKSKDSTEISCHSSYSYFLESQSLSMECKAVETDECSKVHDTSAIKVLCRGRTRAHSKLHRWQHVDFGPRLDSN